MGLLHIKADVMQVSSPGYISLFISSIYSHANANSHHSEFLRLLLILD